MISEYNLKSKIDNCPVCNSNKLKILVGYEKNHLVRCKKRTFVFSNCKPTHKELDKVYNSYIRDDNKRTELTLKKMHLIVDNIIKKTNAKRVLDIGCGDGAF